MLPDLFTRLHGIEYHLQKHNILQEENRSINENGYAGQARLGLGGQTGRTGFLRAACTSLTLIEHESLGPGSLQPIPEWSYEQT
jgi:hypothetical protein